MIEYSNEERLKTLNEMLKNDNLIIRNQPTDNVFTILTQHFTAHTIEDIADYIIHYKKFLEMYGYDRINLFFDMQSRNLPSLRFKAWFDENRKLTEKEENEAVKLDRVIQARWDQINEEFSTCLANELFDELIETKEMKTRKWSMPK